MISRPPSFALLLHLMPLRVRWMLLILLASAGMDAAAGELPKGQGGVGFRVNITAPRALKDALEGSLDLLRWQTYADITPDFLKLLLEDARTQAREIASAQGYFSPTITAEVDESQSPPTVAITIEPGMVTRVSDVTLAVTGPGATDPSISGRVQAARSGWSMPRGSPFSQADWDRAKADAVRELSRERYAPAGLTQSAADIDPDAATAALSVTIDSGPPFRFGPMSIAGVSKYPESLVRNFGSFAPGDDYSQEKLDQFIRRLNSSGYFASAQATVETDPALADAAPVHIAVIEAPAKKLSFGVGFSTDTLYRAQMVYNDANINDKALQLQTDLRLEGKLQSATVRLLPPPRHPDYADGYDVILDHTDIAGLETYDFEGGWRRRTTDERNQTSYALRYYISEQRPSNAQSQTARALYGEYGHTWRRTDDLLAPTRGYMLNAQFGAGPPGVSTEAFGRTILQAMGWIPINLKTQISLRAEVGAVLTKNRQDMPTALLFRLGGDTTVRGYAFQSLGPREGDATVGGRYYTLASGEIVRWIGDAWGLAAFVDAGNAADSVSGLRPVYGYGIGARVRTPIGPFRVDVAYGQEARTVRMHVSVGLSF